MRYLWLDGKALKSSRFYEKNLNSIEIENLQLKDYLEQIEGVLYQKDKIVTSLEKKLKNISHIYNQTEDKLNVSWVRPQLRLLQIMSFSSIGLHLKKLLKRLTNK